MSPTPRRKILLNLHGNKVYIKVGLKMQHLLQRNAGLSGLSGFDVVCILHCIQVPQTEEKLFSCIILIRDMRSSLFYT